MHFANKQTTINHMPQDANHCLLTKYFGQKTKMIISLPKWVARLISLSHASDKVRLTPLSRQRIYVTFDAVLVPFAFAFRLLARPALKSPDMHWAQCCQPSTTSPGLPFRCHLVSHFGRSLIARVHRALV